MKKRLYKSSRDRMLSGVLGGVAEYFDADSALVRLLFVFLVCITGFFPGVFAYLIALLIVPSEPVSQHDRTHEETSRVHDVS